jgi:hypothetical protein
MLDIIILIFLSFRIRDTAVQKGLAPRPWVIKNILAWVGMELIGIVVGLMLFGQDRPIMIILVALPFAIGGYHIVSNQLDKMPDIPSNDVGDDLQ